MEGEQSQAKKEYTMSYAEAAIEKITDELKLAMRGLESAKRMLAQQSDLNTPLAQEWNRHVEELKELTSRLQEELNVRKNIKG